MEESTKLVDESTEALWYVVHTYSGYENKVANDLQTMVENRHLQDLICDVKVPVEMVPEIDKNGKQKMVEHKLFPGYVLVKMVMNDDTWYVVRNTRGCPGMAEVHELDENIKACSNTEPLTEEELAKMDKIREQLGNDFCRRCNYCAPCTVGINIPSVFLFAGYLQRYDLADWAKDRYRTLPVKASACIECGKCEPRCPYHLPIREKLKQCAKDMGE